MYSPDDWQVNKSMHILQHVPIKIGEEQKLQTYKCCIVKRSLYYGKIHLSHVLKYTRKKVRIYLWAQTCKRSFEKKKKKKKRSILSNITKARVGHWINKLYWKYSSEYETHTIYHTQKSRCLPLMIKPMLTCTCNLDRGPINPHHSPSGLDSYLVQKWAFLQIKTKTYARVKFHLHPYMCSL